MACSISSKAKLLSAFVADGLSLAASRRGYAAAASSRGVVTGSVRGAAGAGRGGVMAKKGGEETAKTSSWVPDPVTGYYRPENHANEIDVAELRNMLLKNNIRRH
ncbi:protein SENESCENCE-ASSOCIATED GENE 21, mitochondrial-like [Diospyros lotus]|uniref:protein SENESCENCE-ASSOCIATED GENE 21, mitochondrial-like n=1 Tax=Diospyros lotus TaxID=55363 RepID=UPI00225A47C2|nr:protein SENESCENCE-ASSOCIATED GENE 21, mitochondrial-like [Diospyros lotus]